MGVVVTVTKGILVSCEVGNTVILKHVSDCLTSLSQWAKYSMMAVTNHLSFFLFPIMNMGQKCVLDYQTYLVFALPSLS